MEDNRRNFLKGMTASLLAGGIPPLNRPALAAVNHRQSGHEPGATRPNVLLVICDDLGYGDPGCYGSAIPTPQLDRLAREGTRCTRWNSAHPICSASRAALLTGRYALRSHTPGALFPHARQAMALDEQTLGNLFRDAGYATHAIGKWHLGDEPGYLPPDRGFDTFFGVPWSVDMKPLPLLRGRESVAPDADRRELTPLYTNEAEKIIHSANERPFFLYVAYSYPHDPARGSKAFRGRSEFGDFGDAVQEIDWSVGRMLDALQQTGKANDTIVIFTSDHGPWFQGSPGLLRGRKGTTFEGGVRVPFLLRWPGHVPMGKVSSEWMGHLCVLPTLAAWCGLSLPTLPIDGFDASSTLLHGEPAPETATLYFAASGHYDLNAIRAGAWKLRVAQNDGEIYINDRASGQTGYWLARPELYNLDRDPCEGYDVAKNYPQVLARLQTELSRQIKAFPPEVVAEYESLHERVASRVTPPGAAPRILRGPLPDWAYEPEDRLP